MPNTEQNQSFDNYNKFRKELLRWIAGHPDRIAPRFLYLLSKNQEGFIEFGNRNRFSQGNIELSPHEKQILIKAASPGGIKELNQEAADLDSPRNVNRRQVLAALSIPFMAAGGTTCIAGMGGEYYYRNRAARTGNSSDANTADIHHNVSIGGALLALAGFGSFIVDGALSIKDYISDRIERNKPILPPEYEDQVYKLINVLEDPLQDELYQVNQRRGRAR